MEANLTSIERAKKRERIKGSENCLCKGGVKETVPHNRPAAHSQTDPMEREWERESVCVRRQRDLGSAYQVILGV